jgi:hypothetical protein
MNELSFVEKSIYNTYLHALRTLRNKPFSPRKDFTDFKDEELYHLKRIVTFFSKFPYIKPEQYFAAPFVLHEDQEYIGLDYFSGMPAVKSYTMYMKQLQEKDPDSEEQLQFIASSLKFIGMFCIKNKIKLEEYLSHKTGITYDWMKHVKNHEISIYSLMEFPGVFENIMSIPEDERSLFLGELGNRFYAFKDRYMKSENAKYIVQNGIKKLEKLIVPR